MSVSTHVAHRVSCRMPHVRFNAAVAVAAALALSAGSSSAQVWDGGAGNGLFNDPVNWNPDALPAFGIFGSAAFDGTAPGTIDLAGGTYQLGLGLTLDAGDYTFTNGTLQIAGTSGGLAGGTYTFQTAIEAGGFDNAVNLGNAFAASNIIIDGANGGLVRDPGVGVTRLIKSNPFRLDLLGAHTFSGGLQLSGGLVYFDNNLSLGTGPVNSTNGSSRLTPVGNLTIANNLLVDSSTSGNLGISAAGGGSLTTTGNLVVTANGRGVLIEPGTSLTLAGDITGGSNFTMTGGGDVFFTGARTSTQRITLDNVVTTFDNDLSFGTSELQLQEPGFGIEAVGARTIANDMRLQVGRTTAGVIFKGDITLTGTLNPTTDFGRTRMVSDTGSDLTIAGTTIGSRIIVSGDGDITLASTATINTGEFWFEHTGNAFIEAGVTFGATNIRTAPAGTIVPVGDVVLSTGNLQTPGDKQTATFSGAAGGTLTVDAPVNVGISRPIFVMNDGADVTFNNLNVTDRFELTGDDSGGTLSLNGTNSFDGNIWLTNGASLRFLNDEALGNQADAIVSGDGRNGKLVPVGDRVIVNDVNIGANTGDVTDGLGVSGLEGTLTISGNVASGNFETTAQPADGVLKLHDNALVTVNGTVTVFDDLLIESDGTAGSVVLNNAVAVTDTATIGANVDARVNSTFASTGLSVEGRLGGTGSVTGPVSVVGGTLAPGNSAGTLSVDGTLGFDAAAAYDVELGGLSAGTFDTTSVTGEATLDGTLVVSLLGSFVSLPGDTFEIMTHAGSTGAFAGIDNQTGYAGLTFDVTYDATAVILSVDAALAGDADLDGDVDFADFNTLLGNFGAMSGVNWLDGDFDGNGFVDFNDFNTLLGNFGSAISPAVIELAYSLSGDGDLSPGDIAILQSAIPEPASLGILSLGGIVLRRRRTA